MASADTCAADTFDPGADCYHSIAGSSFGFVTGQVFEGLYYIMGDFNPTGAMKIGPKGATFISPARCGSRAALALDNRIQGFVFCHSVHGNRDGSVSAVCFNRSTFYAAGEDLALYLVSRGLALALPGAPFEYVAFERVAQTRQLGIWGFSVDAISPGRRSWDHGGHWSKRW